MLSLLVCLRLCRELLMFAFADLRRATPRSMALDKPLAIARQYLPDVPVIIPEETGTESDTNSLTSKTPTNEPADLPPEDKVRYRVRLADVQPEPVPEPRSPAPSATTRYTFWRLPLNRFAVSAPVSKNGSPIRPPATLPQDETAVTKRKTSVTEKPGEVKTSAPAVALAHTSVPMPAVIVACLICLLLGSLLRSLLSEADFVIYSPTGTQAPEGEIWRELKRLGEWRIGLNTDLIVALARRRE